MRARRPKLLRGSYLAKAMDYMLKRRRAFTRFLDDGRICLSNNAASALCAASRSAEDHGCSRGSDRTGQRDQVDPRARLAHVLARIAEHPARRIDERLSWNGRCHHSLSDGLILAAIAATMASRCW
jgi:hypothetical protein